MRLIIVVPQRQLYYSSIEDLPMWNWQKVQKTGDFKYLCKVRFGISDNTNKSKEIWTKCFDSFIQLVGLGEDYNRVLKLKQQYLQARCEWIETTNYQAKMKSKFLAIDIEGANATINMKTKGNESDTTIIIEQKLGIKIDLKKITVKEYYDYVDYFTKQAKK